jgi:hypothetical protein
LKSFFLHRVSKSHITLKRYRRKSAILGLILPFYVANRAVCWAKKTLWNRGPPLVAVATYGATLSLVSIARTFWPPPGCMVRAMDAEGFGNCTNIYECVAVCPADISGSVMAKMYREYAVAALLEGVGE